MTKYSAMSHDKMFADLFLLSKVPYKKKQNKKKQKTKNNLFWKMFKASYGKCCIFCQANKCLWACSQCADSDHPGHSIMKTCLYIFDPFKPHFYIVKLGFTGVYIIFLIFAQNIDCWYSLELPHWGSSNEYAQSMFWAKQWGSSNEYPQSMFWAKVWKISEFFSIFGGEIFYTFE